VDTSHVTSAGTKTREQSLPAVSFADGATTFTVLFDPRRICLRHPHAEMTTTSTAIQTTDLVLADWKAVGGAQIAESLSFRIR